jgi:phospholipase/carboxylesterase
MRYDSEGGEKGGFYVPETCTPERKYPLIMALHDGSGTGPLFLWSWLRDARNHGAILVAPQRSGTPGL